MKDIQAELNRGLLNNTLGDAKSSLGDAESSLGDGSRLAVAFGVNFITKAGQPALLYLVPATLGTSVVVGLRRGELSRLLAFEDKTKRDSFVDL